MNARGVLGVIGTALVGLSIGMLLSALVASWYRDGDTAAFLLSAALTAAAGVAARRIGRDTGDLTIREGYGVVSLAWLAAGLAGAIPFLLTGAIASPTAALFESLSGFTTTGATVFDDVETLPHGILFWRALTQWLGGMGIIVLGVAILPFLGVGGMQLFRAEAPGPTPERLRPRIAQTARLLWYVYAGLTGLQALLLVLGGVSPYEAVTHALTTLSTGGFSTRNASIAAFDSAYIQYVTLGFMYLAGVSFALHYRALTSRRPRHVADPEWRFFTAIVLAAAAAIALLAWLGGGQPDAGIERTVRDALFQAVSIATTTGYVTYDYELWPLAAQMILLLLMIMGGMAGSTAGGMKAMRVSVLLRHGLTELRKSVHPRAVVPTRLGRKAVREDVLLNVFGFAMLYLLLFAGGILALTLLDHDLPTAVGAAAATISNIGPGLGDVGPIDNFGWIDAPSQLLLSFLMLVGRLEIFTVLLLFHPDLWRGGRRRG
ncbi:MAG: TrkH family potassium uptake protein [Gemmatimonadota bacterium]